MAATDAEQVVRAYVDACNRQDLDGVLALLDPGMELHEAKTLPGAVSAVGLDSVRRYLDRFTTHWSAFRWEPLEWQAEGDRVLMRARLQLTGRSSGLEVEREWWYLFTVREDRLARQDGFDDRDSAISAFAGE
jgi:ketosteroid isomerase-like protein